MKQIQMVKDAVKGLVIGTVLFYVTPSFIEIIANLTSVN